MVAMSHMLKFPDSHSEPRALSARFDSATRTLTLDLRGGGLVSVPVRDVPELAGCSDIELVDVRVDKIGFYVRWPQSNVALYVPALVQKSEPKAAGSP